MRILKIFFILFIIFCYPCLPQYHSYAKEQVIFSFEKDPQGWELPDWAFDKKDHVGRQVSVSEFQASDGKYALELYSEFTAVPTWQGSYIERVMDVTDWTPFSYLSVDIFLPKNAPRGLRAKIILTVGPEWKWTEMSRTIPLAPGEWTVIKVDLTQNSMSWRRFIDDSFRSDVKKLGVRIESNGKIAYKGPAYIDNVKLSN